MPSNHWLVAFALPSLLLAQAPEDSQILRLRAAVARISDPEHRFQFLLSRARDTGSPRATAAEELLAREAGAAQRLRKAAERSSPRTRGVALAALVRRLGGDLVFALRRSIDDRSASVRRHVFATVRRIGRTVAARALLEQDLIDTDARVRVRAARGLAELGDPKAIPKLVAATRARPCACRRARRPRAHVAFVTQTSVLARMSTEVA